ncbi:hypothetical protein GA0070215_1311 [Micromonospora marina]|uniref:Uncharacterized protein n=1 Tax=Micromonospora marina TaxID=307120 RepID=A0A1C5AH70_9ACTN|nr:hypothetical protein GA0070215_1311 [Micromonospora marina]
MPVLLPPTPALLLRTAQAGHPHDFAGALDHTRPATTGRSRTDPAHRARGRTTPRRRPAPPTTTRTRHRLAHLATPTPGPRPLAPPTHPPQPRIRPAHLANGGCRTGVLTVPTAGIHGDSPTAMFAPLLDHIFDIAERFGGMVNSVNNKPLTILVCGPIKNSRSWIHLPPTRVHVLNLHDMLVGEISIFAIHAGVPEGSPFLLRHQDRQHLEESHILGAGTLPGTPFQCRLGIDTNVTRCRCPEILNNKIDEFHVRLAMLHVGHHIWLGLLLTESSSLSHLP